MRPLAFSERLLVEPTVSMGALLQGSARIAGTSRIALLQYVDEILNSGLPGLRGLPEPILAMELDSYLQNAVDRDIPELGIMVRKPNSLTAWLRAYAAATGGTASYSEIAAAATGGQPDKPSRAATQTFREALLDIWLLDPLPAWAPMGSEFQRLGATPVHHLADPAFAARLLQLSRSNLLNGDGKPLGPQAGVMLGRLFESLAVLSIRVLAQATHLSSAHLRTRNGDREIDLILTRNDSHVLPIVIKLSGSVTDSDVRHLNWFEAKYPEKTIDKVLINTGEFAYRRPDGVAVVPLALLGL
jgi:predicted AAA+ superfamily ATPase